MADKDATVPLVFGAGVAATIAGAIWWGRRKKAPPPPSTGGADMVASTRAGQPSIT